MHVRTMICSASAILLLAAATPAQTPPAQTTQPAVAAAQPGSLELYHFHFTKAAPGKVNELIDAYKQAPVAPGNPGPPLILRHLQGADWDLLVLAPLGKDETLTPTASAEEQKFYQRLRGLSAQHGDTFTSGPPWNDVRTALAGGPAPAVASASTAGTAATTGTAGTAGTGTASPGNVSEGTVYTVTTYRSLPGHRDQLANTLRRLAALFPERRTVFEHVEGASWEFVLLQRYDSWSALGAEDDVPPEKLRAQGFANNDAIGLELRQHAAEHRDTIARLVR